MMHQLRNTDFGQYGKLNLIFEKKGNFDVVYFGSSRTAFHFNPKIIDSIAKINSCNMGITATNDVVSLGAIKTYLSNCEKKPKVIVVNFDFFLWDHQDIDATSIPRFFPYLDKPTVYNSLVSLDQSIVKFKYSKLFSFTYLTDYFYYELYRGLVKEEIARDKEFKGSGFQMLPYQRKINNFHTSRRDEVICISKMQINAAKQIFALAKNEKIILIPVITPIFKSYSFTKSDSLLLERLNNMCDQFGFPCASYLNKRYCKEKNNFFDEIHLNNKGLVKFNKDFANDLIQILSDK
tara:strand:+ start:566 stop:1444 length:879 start_codon:yes stop_codon:yes gene_type:complete